jgi:ankyrin repeat protein
MCDVKLSAAIDTRRVVLMTTVSPCCRQAVQALLRHFADPFLKDKQNRTCLHHAVQFPEVVRLFCTFDSVLHTFFK